MASSSEIREAEDLFEKLKTSESESYLKRHMAESDFHTLKDRKTKAGGTLADCIRSGCELPDSLTGIHASDPEAYELFAPLFDAIVRGYHGIPEGAPIRHPRASFGDLDLNFGDLDPSGKFIVSTRVRTGRSLEGFGFHPVLNRERRLQMQQRIWEALRTLPGELQGTYHPLADMDPSTQQQLIQDHCLFDANDKFRRVAGAYRDWPDGRGIFFNRDKTFLVWVGEEDHLRIISMQPGGHLGHVYSRFVQGVKAMEERLPFVRDARLGYLSFCPSNLGTSLRASVLVHIPAVSRHPDFQTILDRLHLQSRGLYGIFTESRDGIYDLSNKRRLGLTELEAVTVLKDGVREIIKLEKQLADEGK